MIGDEKKYDYYRNKLAEMEALEGVDHAILQRTRDLGRRLPPSTRIQRAIAVLRDDRNGLTHTQKTAHLFQAGLSFEEYLSALDVASGGAISASTP